MFKKLLSAFLILIFLLPTQGCKSDELQRYEADSLLYFDTKTTIIAYTKTKEEFTRFSQLIYDDLKTYHELYDIYHNYEGINNIKTINDKAGKYPVKVDKKIIDMLKQAIDIYHKTDGKVNVAMGSVLRIWHDYRTSGIDDPENADLPPMDDLKEAAVHTDINDIIINEHSSTVFLKNAKMSLDVGAIAKGYATEQVCKTAIDEGITSGLVSVGGNVKAIGAKDKKGNLWNVGVQNPDTAIYNTTLYNVNVSDISLVTSGNYQRYYTVDGEKYHHIIDPETLMPSDYFSSVTVLCNDSGLADGLSTALFNMTLEEGKEYIGTIPDSGALWIEPDGKTAHFSTKFKDMLIE